MKIEQANELLKRFLSGSASDYEFDDFINEKFDNEEVSRLQKEIIHSAMPLSFDRTPSGVLRFKNKIIEIMDTI